MTSSWAQEAGSVSHYCQTMRNNSKEALFIISILNFSPRYKEKKRFQVMCVMHTPALSEHIWNLLQTFTAKNHHFPLLRSVLLLLLLCASPRLSSSRIRAERSCKCAAGGRSSIKLSAGEKISWCAEKTTQLREKRACHVPAPRRPTGLLDTEHDPPPPPTPTQIERERQSHLSLDPAQLAWCQSESSPGSACSGCRTSWCGPEKNRQVKKFDIRQNKHTLLTRFRDLAHGQ